jgi:Bacterial SH3 domain
VAAIGTGVRFGARTTVASTPRRHRPPTSVGVAFALATVIMLVAGCSASSKPTVASTTTATTVPTGGSGAGSAPTVPIQTSGTRTVLSPIGLNVRAQPSTTATILGSAAQGATLTVLGHTGDPPTGWYNVMGATVTGYITDDPTLSAGGKFMAFNSDQDNFSALYPETWTAVQVPPVTVVFRAPSGGDSIVMTTAATVNQLPVAGSGYQQVGSAPSVVVCGITANLITLAQTSGSAPTTAPLTTEGGGATAQRYLIQVNLTLDGTHALGMDAALTDLAQLPTVMNVMYSLSFPYPQCLGGAAATSTTVTPSTVF